MARLTWLGYKKYSGQKSEGASHVLMIPQLNPRSGAPSAENPSAGPSFKNTMPHTGGASEIDPEHLDAIFPEIKNPGSPDASESTPKP